MADEQPWSKLKATIYSFLFRNPKSTRLTLAHAQLESSDTVLDIGCGPGAAVRLAATSAASAVGVDASAPMIEIAKKRSTGLTNVSFETAPAELLPFEDQTYSVVWTIQSWHHWNEPKRAFSEVARVLRPGGRFMIVEKATTGDHGIDEAAAKALVSDLIDAGLIEETVENISKHFIVSARRPS